MTPFDQPATDPATLTTRQGYIVAANDVDFTNHLKLSTLLRFFQDTAQVNANDLQFGYEQLNARGYFWVLMLLHVEVVHLPKWDDAIVAATWPKGIKGPFALRDYLLTDTNDRVLCRATSSWPMLQYDNRRPVRIEKTFPDFPRPEQPVHALNVVAPRLKVADALPTHHMYTVRYTDIDYNRHVNNVRYLDLVMDCFDLDFLEQNQLQQFTINFMSEALFEETLTLHCGRLTHQATSNAAGPEADYWAVKGLKPNGQVSFVAHLVFSQKA